MGFMGLFSNNKKLCPICGGATPKLFSTKVEGMPICKECDRKVDLPDGVIDNMSLEALKYYLSFYEANQSLRNMFSETYRFNFGFGGGSLLLDTAHGLFRLRDDERALVMEASHMKGFCILEDTKPLYEGGQDALRTYQSDVIERVNAMSPQISRLILQQRELEWKQRMAQEKREQEGNGRSGASTQYIQPRMEIPVPFRHFYIEIMMEHPYWGGFRWSIDAPSFDRNYPSIDAYIEEYQTRVDELHTLAMNLMQFISSNALEIYEGTEIPEISHKTEAKVEPKADVNVIEELKQYKELLDAGIITQEEFTAKKKQLLGI